MRFCSCLKNHVHCSLFCLWIYLLNLQIRKNTHKKENTFICYDLLSKWFWWWMKIHSCLWIMYLHYYISWQMLKIDVQMRNSKYDELLPHKCSQPLSASIHKELVCLVGMYKKFPTGTFCYILEILWERRYWAGDPNLSITWVSPTVMYAGLY